MEKNNVMLFRYFDMNQGKHIIISQSRLIFMRADEITFEGMTLQEVYKAVEHEIQVRETIA